MYAITDEKTHWPGTQGFVQVGYDVTSMLRMDPIESVGQYLPNLAGL